MLPVRFWGDDLQVLLTREDGSVLLLVKSSPIGTSTFVVGWLDPSDGSFREVLRRSPAGASRIAGIATTARVRGETRTVAWVAWSETQRDTPTLVSLVAVDADSGERLFEQVVDRDASPRAGVGLTASEQGLALVYTKRAEAPENAWYPVLLRMSLEGRVDDRIRLDDVPRTIVPPSFGVVLDAEQAAFVLTDTGWSRSGADKAFLVYRHRRTDEEGSSFTLGTFRDPGVHTHLSVLDRTPDEPTRLATWLSTPPPESGPGAVGGHELVLFTVADAEPRISRYGVPARQLPPPPASPATANPWTYWPELAMRVVGSSTSPTVFVLAQVITTWGDDSFRFDQPLPASTELRLYRFETTADGGLDVAGRVQFLSSWRRDAGAIERPPSAGWLGVLPDGRPRVALWLEGATEDGDGTLLGYALLED